MADIDGVKINRMFDYLSAGTYPLAHADGAFVFGRADPLVAVRTAELLTNRLVDYALIVGGIGKDSGHLKELKCPEAIYLAGLLRWRHAIPDGKIWVESSPTNGAECCQRGIEFILNEDLRHARLTVVVHPTSLRRIRATLDVHGSARKFNTEWQSTGTEYKFNPENPADQREATAELLRLADWPINGWCAPQADLPLDLVEVARCYKTAWDA